MQTAQKLFKAALADTLADTWLLSDCACDKAAQDAMLALVQRLCQCALDPASSDAQALAQVRALSLEVRRFLYEQGLWRGAG